MQQELKLRIISGIVLAVAVLAATWFGGVWFIGLSVAIGLLVFHEWAAMSRTRAERLHLSSLSADTALWGGWAALIVTGGLVFAGLFHWALLVAAFASLALFAVNGRGTASRWLAPGIFYAGASMTSLAAIRQGDAGGFLAMLFVFAVVWATDIMAYFVGRAVGGKKLAPSISPGKTWSGAIGGAIFGVIAGLAVFIIADGQTSVTLGILALALSVVSQAGDLFESALKRKAGVKDSSHLIPGHGGVMDRVDGLVAAAFMLFIVVSIAQMAADTNVLSAGDVLRQWSGASSTISASGA